MHDGNMLVLAGHYKHSALERLTFVPAIRNILFHSWGFTRWLMRGFAWRSSVKSGPGSTRQTLP